MIELRRAYPNELYHYGIKGQHWGERRFQNENGSLTPAGRERYGQAGTIGRKKLVGVNKENASIKVGKYGGTSVHRRGEGLGSGKVGSGNDRTQGIHAGGSGKDFESQFDKAKDVDDLTEAIERMIDEGGHEAVPLRYDCSAKYVKNKNGEAVLEVRDSDGMVIGRLNPKTTSGDALNKLVESWARRNEGRFRQHIGEMDRKERSSMRSAR